ncbi:hypothetical protein IFR05_002692 [Cadophora sp. M221]|nr:hypothetical protein IFR05_002692 [Cadophora sp. M221]
MEGITYNNVAQGSRHQQNAQPKPKTTPLSYLAPTYRKPVLTQPTTGPLPTPKVTKQTPKLSAGACEKAKRAGMLAKMNDYSEPAPEVAERIGAEEERMALEAAHPKKRDELTGQRPRFTYPTNLQMRESINVQGPAVPPEERSGDVDYTKYGEIAYLQMCRDDEDMLDKEWERGPYYMKYSCEKD